MKNTYQHFIKIIIVLFTINSFAQSDPLVKLESIEIDAEQVVGIDKFKNIYYITDNTIFKKNTAGEVLAFQDVLLGDVETIDILNPNKITVFYKMANTVVILDNRMTEIVRKNFNSISPFRNVRFCGTSKDNGLWVYNMDNNQLELFDYRKNTSLFQTLPINEEILELKSNFNFCYLRTVNKIMVYNIYGSFMTEIPVEDFKFFDLSKNDLLVHKGNQLDIYNKNYELIKSIKFDFKDYQNLLYTSENLYIYNNKILSKYSFAP